MLLFFEQDEVSAANNFLILCRPGRLVLISPLNLPEEGKIG